VKSKNSYFADKLKQKSQSIKDATEYAIGYFDKFCEKEYHASIEEVIKGINAHKNKEEKILWQKIDSIK